MQDDLVRLACERAVIDFGDEGDGQFIAAGFSNELMKLAAGLHGRVDGNLVKAILSGRKDVVPCGGGHYQLLVNDQVNQPTHYTKGEFEVISVIEDWELGFHLGNVVKYVARSSHKGNQLEDLKKARWYLDRMITRLKGSS